MGREHLNGAFSNTMMVIVTWVTLVLGILKLVDAVSKVVNLHVSSDELFIAASLSALVITVVTTVVILRKRQLSLKEED